MATILAIFFFLLLTTSCILKVVYYRLDYTLNDTNEQPQAYFIVHLLTIFLVIYLFSFFIRYTKRICKQFYTLLPRHQLLYVLSFYFIVIYSILVIFGLYTPYEQHVTKLFIMFFTLNLYIYLLSVLWRTTNERLIHVSG